MGFTWEDFNRTMTNCPDFYLDDCLCDHAAADHHKVGDRIECFAAIAEGWLCGCMNYEPASPLAERA